MGAAIFSLPHWISPWRGIWEKWVPHCARPDCERRHHLWSRVHPSRHGIVVDGSWYCLNECLERALEAAFRSLSSRSNKGASPHRIPLGLLLLSRQQVTVEQLRRALEAQRTAGYGRIGEWLRTLGFVNEEQVTAALARQWSRPILRGNALPTAHHRIPQIPLALLESFAMVPVDYIPATATLHIGCNDRIEYRVLYALEQMLECRTEPCLLVSRAYQDALRRWSEQTREREICFEQMADIGECARVVRSYAARVAASEIRLAVCDRQFWVRLFRPRQPPLDLLLRRPEDTLCAPSSSISTAAVPHL